MSEKTLKAILGTLGVLVIVYLGVALVSGHGGPSAADSQLASTLADMRGADIETIHIVRPADSLDLRRAGDSWTVNGYPTDSAAMARLLGAIKDVSVGSLISTNAANHARLDVSEDSALVLTVGKAKGGSDRILLGKEGPSWQSAYARLPDQNDVYLISGDLRGAVDRSLKEWRDKTIVQTDTAKVRTVAVQRDRQHYTLTRPPGGAWQLDMGKGDHGPADSLAVRSLLRELVRVQGTGFPADTVAFRGDSLRQVVTLGAGGDTLAAIEFAGKGSAWLARSRAHPTLVQVPSWLVNQLAPAPDGLRKKPS